MKSMFKIYCSVVALLLATTTHAALVVTNLTSVPVNNVLLDQPSSAGNSTQSRYLNSTSWRGIQQTFVWNSDEKLEGIGIRVDEDQDDIDPFTTDQEHVLYIQSVNGTAASTTVYTATFTLTDALVNEGEYVYLDIDDLALSNGAGYGFSICPVTNAIDGDQRIYWSRSADDDAYSSGVAAQFDPSAGLPDSTYGDQNQDLAFFLAGYSPLLITATNSSSAASQRVVIDQALFGTGSVQSRHRNDELTDWRGIQQTFTWTSDDPLATIGIRVSSVQDDTDPFDEDQEHYLHIQSVDGLSADTNTIYEARFNLTDAIVNSNEYVVLDLGSVALTNNGTYGFSIFPAPSAYVGGQRIYWNRSADNTAYDSGVAAQFNPADGLPDNTYGSAGYDLTFFMTRYSDLTEGTYAYWTDLYPAMGSETGYTDDPDEDGLNNLLEYGLGGIPTTNDAATVQPIGFADQIGGTNWLVYVYNRRTDAVARGLGYEVVSGESLTDGSITNATQEVGSGPGADGFEVVTNRLEMAPSAAFMKLNVSIEE